MSQVSQPQTSPQQARPSAHGHHREGSHTFSFRSDKSGGSRAKDDLTESPREKARRDSIWKATSKANPNAAIQENQPGVNAVLEESTLVPLRSVQHRDVYGNVITDPDLSNPTRPRLERPLDTIRSFEKAIDNGYKRRSSYMRSESESNMHHNNDRRNSGYGFDNGANQNRYANGNGGGYYGGQRAESMVGGGPRRHPNNRMGSDPMMYGQRPYPPQHGHQQSMDTGSDSTGPWANSTDPSSENSSIDRIPVAKPHGENGYPSNGYAHNGYGPNGYQGAIPEEGGYPMRGGAPPVQAPERRPIPLGNSGDAPPPASLPSTKRPQQEKRKSWFGRRFSKKE